jgi:hypothetical protein
VWDGATVKIYLNGQLDNAPAARTGTIGTDTRPLCIGGRSGADYFDGMIRDARIYNRALSDTEIAELVGLLGHWKFSEGSGATAADSSAQGNDATLSGGASWTSDCAGSNNALLTNGSGGVAETTREFSPPEAGTVAFWMRSSGSPSGTERLFGVGGDWEVRQNSDGILAFDLCGEAGTSFITTIPLAEAGRWYHVAATFDSASDNFSVYIARAPAARNTGRGRCVIFAFTAAGCAPPKSPS